MASAVHICILEQKSQNRRRDRDLAPFWFNLRTYSIRYPKEPPKVNLDWRQDLLRQVGMEAVTPSEIYFDSFTVLPKPGYHVFSIAICQLTTIVEGKERRSTRHLW